MRPTDRVDRKPLFGQYGHVPARIGLQTPFHEKEAVGKALRVHFAIRLESSRATFGTLMILTGINVAIFVQRGLLSDSLWPGPTTNSEWMKSA